MFDPHYFMYFVFALKMNLQEYFQRIGFQGSCDKPDLATLREIHKHHILSIPFENLSIHSGERNVVDLEVTFHKLVRRHRGGWCFENNYLFFWVLMELGYNATMLSSKVFNNSIDDFEQQDTHLIVKVLIDGKAFICDVSYGMMSQMWYPLELISGKDQPQPAGVFRLIDTEDVWVLERNRRIPKVLNPEFNTSRLVDKKDIVTIYNFTMTPRDSNYFLECNDQHQINPDSLFTKMSMCSLQTPTGLKALIGWSYAEVTFLPEEGANVFDIRYIVDDEIDKVLKEKFNLVLKNRLQPKGPHPLAKKV
ncbi:arylamine N-acetyltransferase, pineal gland isozyme NAT-3-like isoform X1 [Synchiropus splendidus]|uniref:arylamine N-acetyltransferase, pineal gland isozyme NAT-3-like isoform X1 n=2 Tax=Synchiropus splendidus TaxID=270530 RepID=UPI00237DAEB8|nr:arylamine N-acetyltransferase, pineal gland isozyme NAT-3-like isoform X1 [Synchiropus splendidus]